MKSFLILTLLCIFSAELKAAERFESFNGVRMMGMGGAAIAVVNDETALLSNPAGLGKLRDYFLTVADPEIEMSANATGIAGTALFNMLSPQAMLNKLVLPSNLTKRLQARAQVFPSIVLPNFGFGIFGKYSANGKVDATGTNFEYNYTNDYAGVLGLNFRLFSGIIKIGANARITNRVEVHKTDIPANSTNLTINSIANEGLGVANDVGLILTLPIATLPTIAAVWRDVGNTTYGLKQNLLTSAITIPDHTPQSVDVALAMFPIGSKNMRFSITAEYQDVLTAGQETDVMRRVHGGVEWNIADAVFLRAGWNQRYYTAGLEFAMGNYQLQAATYGEEVGTATVTEEDRRYVFKFAFRF